MGSGGWLRPHWAEHGLGSGWLGRALSPAVTRADGTPAAEVFFCDHLESGDTTAWAATVP